MANKVELAGKHVLLTVSDPWDFVTKFGAKFQGSIIDVCRNERGSEEALLVRLDEPVYEIGSAWVFFVAKARHEGSTVFSISEAQGFICTLTAISTERASTAPFDLSLWRGGLCLLGELRLTEINSPTASDSA